MKGAQSPTLTPLCLKQRKKGFLPGWCAVRTRNAPSVRAEACWRVLFPTAASPWKCVTHLLMSCLFPDGQLHSQPLRNVTDHFFFKYLLCTNCGLSKGLAGFFVVLLYHNGFCAVCCVSNNDDRSGFVVMAVCFFFLCVPHRPASRGC